MLQKTFNFIRKSSTVDEAIVCLAPYMLVKRTLWVDLQTDT